MYSVHHHTHTHTILERKHDTLAHTAKIIQYTLTLTPHNICTPSHTQTLDHKKQFNNDGDRQICVASHTHTLSHTT